MLGTALMSVLGAAPGLVVSGTTRAGPSGPTPSGGEMVSGVDVLNPDQLVEAFGRTRPDVVINAVGLIKQREEGKALRNNLELNAMLPARLADLTKATGARLILVSTDCVFTGDRGMYRESDTPDARDLYGLSKLLGEIGDREHVLTIRTSIIGRETGSARGLIEWFMQAGDTVNGFRHAIFSGFPTVVLAEIIRDVILPRPELHGLYHVSAEPISKLDLLELTADIYGLKKTITPIDEPRIDRSLNSDRFRQETGYVPPAWPALIRRMQELQG